MEELRLAQQQEEKAKAAAENARLDAETKKGEESDKLKDWEAYAEDGVKNSWDAPTDEEEEPATAKPAITKPAVDSKHSRKNRSDHVKSIG